MRTNKGSDRLAFENAVKRYARAQGIKRGAAWAILLSLLEWRDFRRNTAWRSKNDLMEDTGYCRKAIQRGLHQLREAKAIEPVAYEHGGRGCATIYKFGTIFQNGVTKEPPLGAEGEKGVTFSPKGGHFLTQRGSQNDPPIRYSGNQEARQAAPKDERRPAGRGTGGHKAHDGTPSPVADMVRNLTDNATVRRKAELIQEHGTFAQAAPYMRAEGLL